MKNSIVRVFSIIAFFIVAVATFNSCNTNLCQNIACQNNGTCRDGACACPTGYEGPFCQAALADKFVGTWEGYERCNGGVQTYSRYVCVPGNNASEMIIYPFDNQLFRMVATVDPVRTNEFVIPFQTIYSNADPYTFEGRGKVEGNNNVYLYIQKTNPLSALSSCYVEGDIIQIP